MGMRHHAFGLDRDRDRRWCGRERRTIAGAADPDPDGTATPVPMPHPARRVEKLRATADQWRRDQQTITRHPYFAAEPAARPMQHAPHRSAPGPAPAPIPPTPTNQRFRQCRHLDQDRQDRGCVRARIWGWPVIGVGRFWRPCSRFMARSPHGPFALWGCTSRCAGLGAQLTRHR